MKVDVLITETNKLGEAVNQFLKQLDLEMTKPASSQRGANIAKLTNNLFSALVFWHLATEQWRQSEGVKDIVDEYNKQHPHGMISYERF